VRCVYAGAIGPFPSAGRELFFLLTFLCAIWCCAGLSCSCKPALLVRRYPTICLPETRPSLSFKWTGFQTLLCAAASVQVPFLRRSYGVVSFMTYIRGIFLVYLRPGCCFHLIRLFFSFFFFSYVYFPRDSSIPRQFLSPPLPSLPCFPFRRLLSAIKFPAKFF